MQSNKAIILAPINIAISDLRKAAKNAKSKLIKENYNKEIKNLINLKNKLK